MLIIFDLDGVLVDARPLHFHAFNTAIAAFGSQYVLSWEEHQQHYDGLPTRRKLEILTERTGFPQERWALAWQTKQAISTLMVEQVFPDPAKRELLQRLRYDGHTLACVSNSIRATVDRMLRKANLIDLFDYILGNDEGAEPKPSPQCYLRAMQALHFTPARTWIVEDSLPGLEAAELSGAHVIAVDSPDEVTYATIAPYLWHVLIPMAGAGRRFADAGYTFPKPLIEVRGKPMIQVVVENLALPSHYIFLVNADDFATYQLDAMLELVAPGCTIGVVDTLTDGAARTALSAERFLDERPVLVANSDQWVRWDRDTFIEATYKMDGLIPTFESVHPKWSYVQLSEIVPNVVIRVEEKKPVSTHATCGLYWWRHGTEFISSVKKMIAAEDRTNGEFYIAPAYNYQSVAADMRVFPVEEMWGLGTPEDLERYLTEGPS